MSPILDLQRREMEAGRVRFGNKVGNRPNRLDHPLLTSPDKELVETVAAAYGSDVSPWPGGEGQWQAEIEADLRVLVPVSPEVCSQFWERWSGGGCMRRCDGITDQINDAPCDCDKTADKRACSATTRITVLLPETGDARWRIETKSLYAAIELPASLERAQGEKTGEVIPGVLSVEQRPGKKGKVPVPVIRLNKTPGDMVSPGSGDGGARPSPARTIPAQSGAAVPAAPEQPEGVAPSGGRVESPEPDGGSGSGDSPAISEAQRRRLMAKAREHGVSTEDAKELIKDLAGVESSKDIPADKYDTVISAIENWSEWQAQLVPERQEDVG
jgi:hypothetical protein